MAQVKVDQATVTQSNIADAFGEDSRPARAAQSQLERVIDAASKTGDGPTKAEQRMLESLMAPTGAGN